MTNHLDSPATLGAGAQAPAHLPTIERLRALERDLWFAMPRYTDRENMSASESARERALDHRIFGHVAPALDVLNNLMHGRAGQGQPACDCGEWPQLNAIAAIVPGEREHTPTFADFGDFE